MHQQNDHQKQHVGLKKQIIGYIHYDPIYGKFIWICFRNRNTCGKTIKKSMQITNKNSTQQLPLFRAERRVNRTRHMNLE